MTKTEHDDKKFELVEVESLQAGMLVDRPLYVYLPTNEKHILLARPLQPLEPGALEKFRKLGGAYSPEPSLESRYSRLAETARVVRELCDDEASAPFEKNRGIRDASEWLVEHVLGTRRDDFLTLFFFQRAFGTPKPETLLFVSDASVTEFERSLRCSAVAGTLALWLGYSDTLFLAQLAETVFCQSIGAVGRAPGTHATDYRFRALPATDELVEVIELARWIVDRAFAQQPMPGGRVVRKLARQFKLGGFGATPGAGEEAAA